MSQVIPRHINLPHKETEIKRIKYTKQKVFFYIKKRVNKIKKYATKKTNINNNNKQMIA